MRFYISYINQLFALVLWVNRCFGIKDAVDNTARFVAIRVDSCS